MQDEARLALWRRRFEAFGKSGLSVKGWCASNSIPIDRYYYWRRKLSAPCASGESLPQWMAVDLEEAGQVQAPSGGVTVRIGAAIVELQPGFDSVHLRRIIDVLEAGVRPTGR